MDSTKSVLAVASGYDETAEMRDWCGSHEVVWNGDAQDSGRLSVATRHVRVAGSSWAYTMLEGG